MDSTFLGIEIGKRSLLSHRKALNVVGHNLANTNNEQYSRQRIFLHATDPLYRPHLNRTERPGQLGQGVEIAGIRRERDIHLDNRIYDQNGSLSFWENNKRYLEDIESIHNALGDTNLQQKFDKFWQDWQDLAVNPSEPARRNVLVDSAKLLTRDIRNKFASFNSLRSELNERIIAGTTMVNEITGNIAALNEEITSVITMGDNPNDLLDKRDGMVEDLSKLVDLSVQFKDNDEMMLYVGGKILVQGGKRNYLQAESDPTNEGLVRISWNGTDQNLDLSGGEIHAQLTARDTHLTKAINDLDIISNTLIFAVNEIHREGFNSYGSRSDDFFKVFYPGTNNQGSFDTTADGTPNATLLYEIKGNAQLQPKLPVGSTGNITMQTQDRYGNIGNVTVAYGADETVEEILENLNNADDSLNFYLNNDGQLTVKSRSTTPFYPFAIPFLADDGDFLTSIAGVLAPGGVFNSADIAAVDALNANAQYNRTPIKHSSAWIDVRDEINDDHNLIATRSGQDYDGVGGRDAAFGREEGGIADAISRLRHDNTLFENKKTFNEFYVNMITNVSTQINSSGYEKSKFGALHENLLEVRQSISGVNIDEEMSNMLAYQQGYEAGARIVRVMDELLDTLLRMT